MYSQSALAKRYIQLQVTKYTPTGLGDPSASPVAMAFLPTGEDPVSGDWKTGSWVQTPVGDWLAQCLVGPGGAVTLSPGIYYLWIQITDPSELVIAAVGQLEVSS